MITVIKNFFLKRRIAAIEPAQYVGWNKTQSILILCGDKSGADFTYILNLKEALEKAGKTIKLITFVAAKKPKENVLTNAYFKSDIDFIGLPKKNVNQLLTEKYDVAIDWTIAPDSVNDFLVLKSSASFTIGVNKTQSFYDVSIKDDGTNRAAVVAEIVKYLKLINNE